VAAQKWLNPGTGQEERLVNFATLKSSHGLTGQSGLEDHWNREAPEMVASGVPIVGGCHRLLAGDGAAQVQVYLDALELIGGYEGRIVQLDCADADPQTIRDWMAEWNRVTNAYPVLGYLPDWRESGWIGSDLATYGFRAWWASEYVVDEHRVEVEGPLTEVFQRIRAEQWHSQDGVEPTLLQFTSRSLVDGVPGFCDGDVFRGTLAELRELATKR
jgi:hypothetical protein